MSEPFQLQKRTEFEEALADYQFSQHAKTILEKTPLVLMLGVFGAGRNSIINQLIKSDKYYFIVSDTTRPPKVRDGAMEQHGVQYFFRSEDEVLRDIRKGEFLEAEIIHNQQVSGISIRELEKADEQNKIAITDVDLQGTVNALRVKPDTTLIFIVPPSFDEWVERIKGREIMSDQEFYNRMQTAQRILRTVLASDDYKFVINDSIDKAVVRVNEIVFSKAHSEEHHQQAKEVAEGLLKQVEKNLGE